jgi:hypothetical protein
LFLTALLVSYYGVARNAPAIWRDVGVTFTLAGFILAVKVRNSPVQKKRQEMTRVMVDECRL